MYSLLNSTKNYTQTLHFMYSSQYQHPYICFQSDISSKLHSPTHTPCHWVYAFLCQTSWYSCSMRFNLRTTNKHAHTRTTRIGKKKLSVSPLSLCLSLSLTHTHTHTLARAHTYTHTLVSGAILVECVLARFEYCELLIFLGRGRLTTRG